MFTVPFYLSLDFIDIFRDKKMETFLKFVKGFDDHNKGLLAVLTDNKKKHLGREYIFYYANTLKIFF